MSKPISSSKMVSILKAEGVNVSEYKSWKTHNRNHKGSFSDVKGVVVHHTVTGSNVANTVALCYNGHSSLPGPLCHAVGGKDGKIYLVSNGRANHAGNGDPDVLNAVIAEKSTLPPDNQASVDGNARFYGIEIQNLGNGKDVYPAKQYDQAVRWAAAICRYYGWTANSIIGHKEWQPGKIDPHGPVEGQGMFSMETFRKDVSARLRHSASWTPGDSKPTPPKPATPQSEASQEVSVLTSVSKTDTDNVNLVPATWTTVGVDGTDLVTGAVQYSAQVNLTLDALSAMSTVQGRFYRVNSSGVRQETYGIIEREMTMGSSFMDFGDLGSLAAGEKLRFEAIFYPLDDQDSTPAVVQTSRLRALVWS